MAAPLNSLYHTCIWVETYILLLLILCLLNTLGWLSIDAKHKVQQVLIASSIIRWDINSRYSKILDKRTSGKCWKLEEMVMLEQNGATSLSR